MSRRRKIHRDELGRFASQPAIARLDSSTSSTQFPPGTWGYYDAVKQSGARSSILSFPLTARREITPWVRSVVLQKLRSLEANLGIIQRMKSQVSKYAVGFGIFP